jgi:hypothetical protein
MNYFSPEGKPLAGPVVTTVVLAPRHGKLELDTVSDSTARTDYAYLPDPDYYGLDKVSIKVQAQGKVFLVRYTISVAHLDPEDGTCPITIPEYLYPPKNTSMEGVAPSDAAVLPDDLWAWIRGVELAGVASDMSGVTLSFESLSAGSVGQTIGEGLASDIVLDNDGSGHGWFVDPTPALNDEFLPTADPSVWKARPGSAAAGRMDMLSVLLHEYGHALGLAHSADPHDFMAATLQPGERRLPTADELALMSRLVAELKADATADGNSPDAPPSPTSPSDPFLPTSQRSATGTRLARRGSSAAAGNSRRQ